MSNIFAGGARIAGDAGSEPFRVETPDNTGLLFKNLLKTRSSDPDLRGRLVVDGVEYRMHAWWATGHDGSRYLKLRTFRADANS
jgi:hypothetical protein